MTESITILRKQQSCTRDIISGACMRLIDTVIGLQGIRATYNEGKSFEPREKFRTYTITISEKVE